MAAGDVTVSLTNAISFKGARFDGVDDYISIGTPSNLDIISDGTKDFSVSFWILLGELSTYNTVLSRGGYWRAGIAVLSDGRLRFNHDYTFPGTAVNAYSVETVNPNEWTNVIAVYNSSLKRIYLYINGTEVTYTSHTDGDNLIDFSVQNLSIGYNSTSTFSGSVRDLRIYKTLLSSSEISKLSNSINVYDGLVSLWKLKDDYKDYNSNNDGVNNGTFLASYSGNLAKDLNNARTTSNDHYMMTIINGKVLTAVVEEA